MTPTGMTLSGSSTRRIFKYKLAVSGREMIQTHEGAQFLSVGVQDGFVCLWAAVDETKPLRTRIIRCVTTGEIFNPEACEFIGTFQFGTPTWFVGHVWEQVGKAADPIHPRFKDDFNQVKAELKYGDEAPQPQ